MAKAPAKKKTPAKRVRRDRDQDLVKVYLNQMSVIPPISVEEERILARELEDSRAWYRERILGNGYALSEAAKLLTNIVIGRLPVDRVLLIEANDNAKKLRVRKELKPQLIVIDRDNSEHRRIYTVHASPDTCDDVRAHLRRALDRKKRDAVGIILPYRIQISRLLPIIERLEKLRTRMVILEDQMRRIKTRRTEEARTDLIAVERESTQLSFQAQAKLNQLSIYLDLVEQGKQRYEEAKKALSKKNLRLVVSIAKKFRNKGLPFLDLIQEGNTGLMKALDRYQASRGNKFSTYATWWIKQTITRSIAYQSRTVRIPIHAINNLNRLIEDREDFLKRNGRKPSLEEMARISDIAVKEVTRLLELHRSSLSLDQPYGNGDEGYFGELIEDQKSETPVDASQHSMLKESIQSLLKTLSYREREVLKLRYGLGDGYTYTLEEVGAIFKVSRERIRQIEVGALQKLQLPQRRDKLRGFWEEVAS